MNLNSVVSKFIISYENVGFLLLKMINLLITNEDWCINGSVTQNLVHLEENVLHRIIVSMLQSSLLEMCYGMKFSIISLRSAPCQIAE